VVSIILTDTTGGTLVNAVVLPQQGEPATFENTNVRIRGAVGLSAGSAATVSVGGTSILASRPARSYIADAYTTLAAGSVPVSVSLDNTTVASGTVTLEPGGDYTLVVWDIGGATQLTLVADDNHVSAADTAKLRLINGASGLAAPLTLSVDYSPVAEYIDVGAASGYYDELGASTQYRLDVTNAQTLATLLTREDVTFQDGHVYTLFLAGTASAVVGTLRRDR
jgi:hypothetical protein